MDPVLLVLAGISAFVIYRLISVMGTRTGHEQRPDLDAMQRAAGDGDRAADDARDAERGPEAQAAPKPVSSNARTLREADPAFDETAFLDGARSAYEMIVEAFAAGDIRSIRPYLSESVYDAFKSAVSARDAAGHASDVKFVGIENAAIAESSADSDFMNAVVAFTSNQVRVTRDQEGTVVDGDPNRIDLVKDRWTFSRKRASRDPNWVLVATGGAA